MTNIFVHYPSELGGSCLYRCILPVRCCAPDLIPEGISLTGDTILDQTGRFDAYVFHGVIRPELLPYVRELKNAGRTVVWSLDDAEFHVPEWNPVRRTELDRAVLRECLALADQVWISELRLRDAFGLYESRTRYLPNLIHPSQWPPMEPEEKSPVRIVWAGGPSHEGDLALVVPVVERLIEEYGEKVVFLFFGYLPTGLATFERIAGTDVARVVPSSRHVGYAPGVPVAEYPMALCDLRPDIGICPLAAHPYNECKTPIKWMELTLAGAAVLSSDYGPYLFTKRRAEDANDWYDSLKQLIEYPQLRFETWEQERQYIDANCTWEGMMKGVWLDAFRYLVPRADS